MAAHVATASAFAVRVRGTKDTQRNRRNGNVRARAQVHEESVGGGKVRRRRTAWNETRRDGKGGADGDDRRSAGVGIRGGGVHDGPGRGNGPGHPRGRLRRSQSHRRRTPRDLRSPRSRHLRQRKGRRRSIRLQEIAADRSSGRKGQSSRGTRPKERRGRSPMRPRSWTDRSERSRDRACHRRSSPDSTARSCRPSTRVTGRKQAKPCVVPWGPSGTTSTPWPKPKA